MTYNMILMNHALYVQNIENLTMFNRLNEWSRHVHRSIKACDCHCCLVVALDFRQFNVSVCAGKSASSLCNFPIQNLYFLHTIVS